jgi:hypothetical protein
LHDFLREIAFCRKLVEPFDRYRNRLSSSHVLLGSLGVAFPAPYTWARPSARITRGSIKPRPTSVTKMTANVRFRTWARGIRTTA